MKHRHPAPHANTQADIASHPTASGTKPESPEVGANERGMMNRRNFLTGAAGAALLSAMHQRTGWAAESQSTTVNLAKVASASSLYTSGDTKLSALNDGLTPEASNDNRSGSFGTWPRLDPQWVQYEWTRPVTTNKVDLYWWIDGAGVERRPLIAFFTGMAPNLFRSRILRAWVRRRTNSTALRLMR
jgi:hypothetical protein